MKYPNAHYATVECVPLSRVLGVEPMNFGAKASIRAFWRRASNDRLMIRGRTLLESWKH
jgi:hypothetical protein